MTVSSSVNQVTYSGNSATTVFPVNFYFLANSHIKVVLVSNNIETVQTITSQYTVTGAGNPAGGSVTMLTPPATGTQLIIVRNVPATQETDYLANDPFPAESHERALDKLTMLVQQVELEADRALKIPLSSLPTTSTELPVPSASKLLAWNSNASAITNLDPADVISVVGQQNSYADVFTGNGVTTSFTLTRNPGTVFNIDVSINGVTQVPNVDYILAATTLTFTSAPPAVASQVLARYSEVFTLVDGDAANVRYLPAGGVQTTVQAKLRESVSVKDFGAVGDGVADDTVAIQAALDSGAGQVTFPDGTYLISAQIEPESNQTLLGTGGTLTMVNGTFDQGVYVDTKLNVRIDGLRIIGASGGNSFDQAILVNASTNITIENCLIQDIGNEAASPNEYGHGVEIDGSSVNVKIINNTIKNVKGFGSVRGDGITVRTSSNTLIQGNTIDTTRRMQIAVIDDAIDVKIISNHLLNGYLAGIDIEPNSVNTTGEITIQGNTIRNFGIKPGATIGNQYYGIDLHSNAFDNISIVGNIISAENAQAISCIHAQNLAKFATISSNVLWCNGYADGMTLNAGNGFKNLVISGNIIREFAINGIIGDKNGNVVIDANILESSQATAIRGISLNSAVGEPTYTNVTGNNIKISGASVGLGINLQNSEGVLVENNIVSVSGGDAITVSQNTVIMVGAVVSNNFVIDTGSGVNAYRIFAAGTGAVANCVFEGNAESGFTTHLSTSGSVTFARSINPAGFAMNIANTVIWLTGNNTPEGAVTASVGSLFLRTNGGAGTTLYVKESGTGNTGWVAK